jgi:hypothetical protein
MAGLGFRTFSAGAVLTAAQVQNYLQDQAVQVHASAAARSSALGTAVAAGMVSYRSDDKALELYAGSAWTPVMQGRNAIINGGFDIWQRGTSVTIGATNTYSADRWVSIRAGGVTGLTVSRQTSTLTGFQYAARVQRDSGNTSTAVSFFVQNLETATSIPYAGQTVTFSFYARAGANFSSAGIGVNVASGTGTDQNALSGFTGSTFVISQTQAITTTWTKYSFTGTVPSNSTQLAVYFTMTPVGTAGANDWFEVDGIQLETGSVATPFVRAGGTLQGELAACQRYYYRWTAVDIFGQLAAGNASATTAAVVSVRLPVTMRTAPTSIDFTTIGTYGLHDQVNAAVALTTLTIGRSNPDVILLNAGVSSGLTQYRNYNLGANNSATAYIGFSSEL